MSEPFLGEIRPFAFNFPPKGWAFCNGQLLPIAQNQALFSILGTMYGGNGTTTFALPDLRGRSPMHPGPSRTQGEKAGNETQTLTPAQMPAHNHFFQCSTNEPDSPSPAGAFIAAPSGQNIYGTAAGAPNTTMIISAGQSQPFNNMQPSLALNYCIALQGIFPSRN